MRLWLDPAVKIASDWFNQYAGLKDLAETASLLLQRPSSYLPASRRRLTVSTTTALPRNQGTMPAFWTPQMELRFYQAVAALQRAAKDRTNEVVYRDQHLVDDQPGAHSLKFKHELQIADHIAYLAHSQEGVEAVSAACVEEHDEGLVLRLASNHSPTDFTIAGLRTFLDSISIGATQEQSQATLREQLFEKVLLLSKNRILQRIRPPWVPIPAHYHKDEEPLWRRMEGVLRRLRPLRSEQHDGLWTRLQQLVTNLKQVDQETDGDTLMETLRSVVKKCADISYYDGNGSLEEQIRRISSISWVADRRDVAQIDKLSRYYGLCKDLSKIVTHWRYRPLFRNITMEGLTAYPGRYPRGATRICFVHAEVQLIMYYEQYPPKRYPRAIGGSKSACLLCDLLIQKMVRYSISYTHRRLYPQWTIPDAPWMDADQAKFFQGAIESMISEIGLLTMKLRQQGHRTINAHKEFARESRAVLPLRSGSTTAQPSEGTGSPNPIPEIPPDAELLVSEVQMLELDPVASIGTLTSHSNASSSLRLSMIDLPFQQPICVNTPNLYLIVGELSLDFEFVAVTSGQLSVNKVKIHEETGGDVDKFSIADIPAAEEKKIACSDAPALKFQLCYCSDFAVEIEFLWV